MRILITNDDGIHAPGLAPLERIARTLTDDVWVVAPETDQSGLSHSLSLNDPLRLREAGPQRFALRGTPSDCVIMAVRRIMEGKKPDLILSGEIMAIALATVADRPFGIQAGALVVVGLALTVAVYGVVGLIVKMDDIGVHVARKASAAASILGRGLVKAMPQLLKILSFVGTAAMLWVGGGIIVHGLEHFELNTVPHLIHELSEMAGHAPGIGAVTEWVTFAAGGAVVGFIVGSAITLIVHRGGKGKH